MEQFDKSILADLYSKNRMRVQSAIWNLKEKMNKCEEITMTPFGVEILDPFGDNVPKETQLDFLMLIGRYHSFVPKLSDEDKIATMISLVLRYGLPYITFEVALKLKISAHPVQAVQTAMLEIVRQGLFSTINVKGAAYLISRLLDGKDEVRKATLQNLCMWPADTPYLEVIEYIKPQLNPDELEFLKGG